MSVREEERNKNCPSRGLGIAAAAIGVGVGAALYYYFSKRQENPADEGATTSNWSNEGPHVLQHDPDSSYTTISEHSTTDTSVHDTSSSSENFELSRINILRSISRRLWNNDDSDDESSEYTIGSDDEQEIDPEDFNFLNNSNAGNISLDSETNTEWDVTTSSLDIPRDEPRRRSPLMMEFGELTVRLINPQGTRWKSAGEQMNLMRDQAFREREWTLEECSICFEGLLKEQEVLSLACTHRFHQACIMPWLQEHQTCPNCRKAS